MTRSASILPVLAVVSARSDAQSPLLQRPESSCHVPGQCPSQQAGRFSAAASTFTNMTGWSKDSSACCDICASEDTKVHCFDKSKCGQKKGDVNDWDFLVFDQIWMPQYCRALEQGHDPTMTHSAGTRCSSDAQRLTGLSIHGLWPNYYGGFPACCQKGLKLPQSLPDDLLEVAKKEWSDPTFAAGDKCSVCSMWAHETMKHGSCFSNDIPGYFRSALGVFESLKQKTMFMNAFLEKSQGKIIDRDVLAVIHAPFKVEFMCDLEDPRNSTEVGVFLEMHTCWNRKDTFTPEHADAKDLHQIDCPPSGMAGGCPERIYIPAAKEALAMGEDVIVL
eukprot:TRINITY_DN39982_c0_g1_i1.p1 TRINITY_DN39982_c0_g1~~TRINITY_DN39982_c0_g1_i1.p1  ORF type:complete len:334 (-),score=55.28 TRINITY_DN39982_c0_g1_i1:222-1223(-)